MSGYTDPQDLNRYSYVNNNPLRYTDPTGHMRVEDGPQSKGCSDPKYCNNGKPKPKEELKKMRIEGIRNKPVLTATVTPMAMTNPLPTVTPTMDLHVPAQCYGGSPCIGNFVPSATPSAISTPYNALATAGANLDIAANTAIASGINYCFGDPEPPCGKTAEDALDGSPYSIKPLGTVFDHAVGTAHVIDNAGGLHPPTQTEQIISYAAGGLSALELIAVLVSMFVP